MHLRLLAIFTLTIITSLQRAEADARAEAKQHVDRATALHARGRFSQALDELKTAFSLDPRPELLYAMGQIHVSLGQCPRAITYYRRYLATNPAPNNANVAIEAIKACETNPPPPAAALTQTADGTVPPDNPAPSDRPAPPDSPVPPDSPASLPPKPAVHVASKRAWFSDHIADAMVAGGVAAGLVGIFEYRSALQNRDRADTATGFQRYVDLVDRAHSQRATAIVFGVAGAALVTAGGLRYVLTGRRARQAVSIGPSQGGGVVTWTGWFQ